MFKFAVSTKAFKSDDDDIINSFCCCKCPCIASTDVLYCQLRKKKMDILDSVTEYIGLSHGPSDGHSLDVNTDIE